MLYRRLLTVFFVLVSFNALVLAQNKMYLEYNNDCMTRMEYKAVSATKGGNLVHYYAQTSAGTRLIMELRKNSELRLASRPTYMMPCSKVNYNENLMRQCNTGELDLYVVGRDKRGYFANYVESISLLKDNGQRVSYNSFTYGFNYDKNNLDPSMNIASNADFHDVMYRGETGYSCLKNLTFRESTKNTCGTYTDITFSPELGMLKMTEFENPQFSNGSNDILSDYQLMYINNLPVDNFVGSYCQGRVPRDPTLYVAPPVTIIPDEFSSRGETVKPNVPVIAEAPKPTPPKPAPKPAPKAKNDFTNGIAAGSAHGEPTVPVNNYIPECNVYKKAGYHIVRPKENLYSISRMTGIPVANLIEWNGISNKEIIPACSELRLIPRTPDMYDALTKKGETKKEIPTTKAVEVPKDVTAKNVNKKPRPIPEIEGVHVVKNGETLYMIAKKHGYTTEKLMEINGLDTDIISPDMVLKTSDCKCDIPEDYAPKGGDIPKEYDATSKVVKGEEMTHQLAKGETLYQISKKYDVSVERIMLLNKIKDATDLSIGQELKIK